MVLTETEANRLVREHHPQVNPDDLLESGGSGLVRRTEAWIQDNPDYVRALSWYFRQDTADIGPLTHYKRVSFAAGVAVGSIQTPADNHAEAIADHFGSTPGPRDMMRFLKDDRINSPADSMDIDRSPYVGALGAWHNARQEPNDDGSAFAESAFDEASRHMRNGKPVEACKTLADEHGFGVRKSPWVVRLAGIPVPCYDVNVLRAVRTAYDPTLRTGETDDAGREYTTTGAEYLDSDHADLFPDNPGFGEDTGHVGKWSDLERFPHDFEEVFVRPGDIGSDDGMVSSGLCTKSGWPTRMTRFGCKHHLERTMTGREDEHAVPDDDEAFRIGFALHDLLAHRLADRLEARDNSIRYLNPDVVQDALFSIGMQGLGTQEELFRAMERWMNPGSQSNDEQLETMVNIMDGEDP
jgi:hypothetical protein